MYRPPISAEEFYNRTLERSHILRQVSASYAAVGDSVSASASQWSADIVDVQAVAWERIVVTSKSGQRDLFDLGERIGRALSAADSQDSYGSARACVEARRRILTAAVDEALADDVASRWSGLEHLEDLAAPSRQDWEARAATRLAGLTLEDYVSARMQEAREAMGESRSARVRGDVEAAIEAAYRSDMLALDAYLVDSASRVADSFLVTVQIRWDLAVTALAKVGIVPEDVHEALKSIRSTIGGILGPGEEARLADYLQHAD